MNHDRTSTCIPAVLLAAFLLAFTGCSGEGGTADAGAAEAAAAAEAIVAAGVDLASSGDEQAAIRELLEAGEGPYASVTIDYPADGTIYPPDMAAPTFLWHDGADKTDRWLVDFEVEGGQARISTLVRAGEPPRGEIDPRALGEVNEIYRPTEYQASARAWRPPARLWEAFRNAAAGKRAGITISGVDGAGKNAVVSRGRLAVTISTDPVGAPIFYRDVPLLPSKTKDGVIKPLSKGAVPLIGWRLRDVGRDDSRLLLEDMPTCANCHSFTAGGETLAMDIDGPNGDKGAYGIVPIEETITIEADQVISWNEFEGRPEDHITLGFLSRISPDGRHVVTTVNEDLYVQNFLDYKFSQVFYPTRGILAWLDRETGEIDSLPGADDPGYVHCNGVWTPDGETIIFSRARARDPYPTGRPRAQYAGDPNETPMRYDLYRVPFNGGLGGRPEPIPGASANGMSNTFPKVSPDGKWLVFVKCKNGQLMRPDGRLWIVPLQGGEAREMNCNLEVMNSWHSFSPNGRWMVFSSKTNTPYTQMFLTHIDENGNDSPAVLIENATAANRAVNIPEFVNIDYGELTAIDVPAVDHWRHLSRGAALSREGRHQEAIAEFEKALEGKWHAWRSNDWKTHSNMGSSLLALGRKDEAIEHYRESLRLESRVAETHTDLGYALIQAGRPGEAAEHMDMAVRLSPNESKPRVNRATLRMNRGDRDGALEDYSEAIKLDSGNAAAYNGRGVLLMSMEDLTGALSDFNASIRLEPRDPTPWYFRSRIRFARGDFSGAEQDAGEALQRVGGDTTRRRDIETLLAEIRGRANRSR